MKLEIYKELDDMLTIQSNNPKDRVFLSRPMVTRLAGDEGYYFSTCKIRLMPSEYEILENFVVLTEEQKNTKIVLEREGERDEPGWFNIKYLPL